MGDSTAHPEEPPVPDSGPSHAWETLTVTYGLIRHADAKIGVNLAFTGATAAVLVDLIRGHRDWGSSVWPVLVAFLAVVGVIGSIVAAVLVLFARTESGVANLLFFGSIRGMQADGYKKALAGLVSDPEALTHEIAGQIHANAGIAATKFRFTNWSVGFEIGAVLATLLLAFLLIIGW